LSLNLQSGGALLLSLTQPTSKLQRQIERRLLHKNKPATPVPSIRVALMSEKHAAKALETLHDWVQSESLRKHCYAVADSMKHFALLRGEDADLWEAVGLLHDMDYEQHPNLERSSIQGHPFVGVAWLRDHGWSEEVCRAILSHADYANVSRETPLEKTLYAVDELSGFIVAVALVRPTKSIHDVDVRAVKKKMKDKAFARAVNREDILRGAEKLDMPLDNLIAEVVGALKSDAERLGVAGTPR
jgi:putative nucleotidyltransferase with HDIG domain